MENEFIIILVCLAFSALFSGVEMAFISANRLHIVLQKRKSKLSGIIFAKHNERPSYFITAMLIGNTIALVVYSIYMAKIFDIPIAEFIQSHLLFENEDVLDIVVMIAQSIFSTLIVLALAEFLPKSLAMINPNKVLDVVAVPIDYLYRLLHPVIFLTVKTARLILKLLFGMKTEEDKAEDFGLTDLNHYLNNIEPNKNNFEIDNKILTKAVEFKTLRVRDCMTPRTEIVAVDKADGLAKLNEVFIESEHTKVPIFENSVDNIVGYCHALDMFRKPTQINEIISPMILVPESTSANELMLEFIAKQKSIAIVLDEFGGTAGLITIEDIMEQIVGEIKDEYDDTNELVTEIAKNVYLVNARSKIDELNESYQWNIPEGDYETLGGYIISITEDIPETDEIIQTEHFEFSVVAKKDMRLDMLRVRLKNSEERTHDQK